MQNLHRAIVRLSVFGALISGLFTAAPLAHANGQEVKQSVTPNGVYQNIKNGDQHIVQVVNSGGVHQDVTNGSQHVSQDVGGHNHGDPQGSPSVMTGQPAQQSASPSASTPASQPVTSGSSTATTSTFVTASLLTISNSPGGSGNGGSGGGSNHRKPCNPLPDDRVNSGAADAWTICMLPADYPMSYLDYSKKPEWLNWYSNLGLSWLGWELLQPTPALPEQLEEGDPGV